MSEISDEEWNLLKHYFGDLAYEEPHNHERFLAFIRGLKEIEAGEVKDFDDVITDVEASIGLGELERGESVDLDDVVTKAKAILDQ